MASQNLEVVLSFAALGWQCFPANHLGKKPATRHGLHDATTDLQQLNQWFGDGQLYNIAIRTGAASGFDVLDVDGDDGVKALQALIAVYGNLPKTPCVRTGGGGLHYYFKHADGVSNSASKIAEHLDVRGDGGYVIAPPSVHGSGAAYEWIIPPEACDLADWPQWLLDRIRNAAARPATAEQPSEPSAPIIPAGQRNQTLTSIAGAMRKKGLDADSIEAALLSHNRKYCRPPLPDNEISRIAKSVGRYTPDEKPVIATLRCRSFSEIHPKGIDYVIPEVLPAGKITSLISQEGVGKSTLASYLAAVVSTGRDWPTGGCINKGSVLIFSHEESPECAIAPRLIANNADTSKIYLGEDVVGLDGTETEFDIEKDIHLLDDWADRLSDLKLVIFDPITSFVACAENSNSEVRRALKPLVDFAERREVAILSLTHLSKRVDLGMINRTLGSRAWSSVPRLIWGLKEEYSEDEDGNKVDTYRRYLLCVKCNLGRKPQGLRFAIEDDGQVVFDAERFNRDIDAEVGGTESHRANEIGDWLIERIGADAVPASEIIEEGCSKWGISSRRLGGIAKKSGINKRFSVVEKCWVWTVKR